MSELYFYSTPKGARLTLTLDAGGAILTGVPCTAHGRDDAQRVTLPGGTGTQGSLLEVSCDGYTPFSGRGIVDVQEDPYPDAEAAFLFDDIRLQELVAPPTPEPPEPEPTPPPSDDPEAIIQAVYELDDHDLSTHEGCGEFTEACCDALRAQHSMSWGHIRKDPGQNNYHGHAVDALYLLYPVGPTKAGVYDIIHDSVSASASPSFNWKDAGDPSLWYYDDAVNNIVLTAQVRGPQVALVTFERELEHVINQCSQENGSNTPDFILAQFLMGCLQNWNAGVTRREQWYGRSNAGPASTGGRGPVASVPQKAEE